MPDDVIDTEARHAAQRANERITDHQDRCGDQYAKLEEGLERIAGSVEKLANKTVSNDRYRAVEVIVYGLVGLILTGVITAIVSGILK